MDKPWWFGPYRSEIPLSRDQQLIVHCWFAFTKDQDEVDAAIRDFPSYLRRQLDDVLAQTGHGIEISRQLLAAGLLTYGHMDMVDVILNNMPPGLSAGTATGYCVAAPSNILSRLLPLPKTLASSGVHSVIDPQRVREWFEKHRGELIWDPGIERFRLVTRSPT